MTSHRIIPLPKRQVIHTLIRLYIQAKRLSIRSIHPNQLRIAIKDHGTLTLHVHLIAPQTDHGVGSVVASRGVLQDIKTWCCEVGCGYVATVRVGAITALVEGFALEIGELRFARVGCGGLRGRGDEAADEGREKKD